MSYSQRGRRRNTSSRSNNRSRYGRSNNNKSTKSLKHRVAQYTNTATEPLTQEQEYTPQHTFADFSFDQRLLKNILARGFEAPLPIQDQSIPELMNGRDVVGIANTGTGKTAAFLLPMIQKVLEDDQQGVLILAPTRELALQINEEFKEFAKNLPMSVAICIGGKNIRSQINQLRENPHFVIGTPGRIKDLLQRRELDLRMFSNIILDEVDRMLDIGFRKDILYFISKLPEERHAAFFSATMDKSTEEIMKKLMHDPVKISVKKTETNEHIEQDVIVVKNRGKKTEMLHDLLIQEEFERVIIFGRTKRGVNKLEQQLSQRGFKVTAIHGNKSQGARQRALRIFKDGHVQALLATDVAARGIDIDDVTHVINYDEPESYSDYVHRIGRTGRAGKIGNALTFIE